VLYSLKYIHGIGPSGSKKILADVKIDPTKKVKDLTDEEVSRIREKIDKEFTVEGELRREVTMNIKRLIEIGSRRGTRHKRNLPARGQRTRTNARTKRGAKRTVAGRGQKRGATKK
jgi:small subunit ribosomal protein S13